MNYSLQQTNVELVLCIVNLILLANPYNIWSTLKITSINFFCQLQKCLRRFLFVPLFNISLTSFCMKQSMKCSAILCYFNKNSINVKYLHCMEKDWRIDLLMKGFSICHYDTAKLVTYFKKRNFACLYHCRKKS